jgi:thiol:disulfide interchange protein
MLKAMILLFLSLSVFAAEEHATISMQRWEKKLVISINHDKGWHTYWKNPGDAGIASSFKFSKEIKPLEWPSPKKYIEAGDILTIGYSDLKHFFFEEAVGDVEVKVGVLICKDICIPGEAILKLSDKDAFVSNRPREPYDLSELKKAFDDLPAEANRPLDLEYYLTRVKDQPKLTLHYALKNIKNPKLPHELNLLTAFPQSPWGFKRESLYFKDGTLFGKTEIEWDGEYQEPPVDLPQDGKFTTPYELKFLMNAPGMDKVQVISLKAENVSLENPTLNDFYKSIPPLSGSTKSNDKGSSGNIFEYLLFAFLGGLILNLMPCVLPVISLKLFGLIKHQNLSKQKLLKHNLTYTAGVISTFIGLGVVVAGIKASGEEIGWGFQLQSPAFLLIMILILFILSLNLFGLFEFKTPGGSKLGSTELSEGFTGDFLSGVLTTILSTPCSAPFLGTALAFAFTTSTFNIFLMFIFIGLGLSFPFLMTALFPKSLHILPRPGAWMEKLKYFLGLTLLFTVVWLYDVCLALVNAESMSVMINFLFILWFFAFFSAKNLFQSKIILSFLFALPLLATIFVIKNLELKPLTVSEKSSSTDQWKPWSEEKLISEKGTFVFVDFTAEWCLTCKVNKKLVLETDGFNELAKKHNVTLMRADWTKRDDNITQFLKRYNVVGVPAYFIQKPSGEIISLGETITLGKIEGHLN